MALYQSQETRLHPHLTLDKYWLLGYFRQGELEPGFGGALTKLVAYQQCLIFRKSGAHPKEAKPLHRAWQEQMMAATFGVFLSGGLSTDN